MFFCASVSFLCRFSHSGMRGQILGVRGETDVRGMKEGGYRDNEFRIAMMGFVPWNGAERHPFGREQVIGLNFADSLICVMRILCSPMRYYVVRWWVHENNGLC